MSGKYTDLLIHIRSGDKFLKQLTEDAIVKLPASKGLRAIALKKLSPTRARQVLIEKTDKSGTFNDRLPSWKLLSFQEGLCQLYLVYL